MSDVLNSDVKLLGDLSLSDLLLNHDSDRSWVDIEDLSSSSVVEVVRHSLMDGSVNYDVDVVAESVLLEVVVHSNGSVSSEALGKLMSGS